MAVWFRPIHLKSVILVLKLKYLNVWLFLYRFWNKRLNSSVSIASGISLIYVWSFEYDNSWTTVLYIQIKYPPPKFDLQRKSICYPECWLSELLFISMGLEHLNAMKLLQSELIIIMISHIVIIQVYHIRPQILSYRTDNW